jgi:hypothetical protein
MYLMDIPSLYHRLLMGSIMSKEQLISTFKQVLKAMAEDEAEPEQIGEYSMYFLDQIYHQPRDQHMFNITELIKTQSTNKDITLLVILYISRLKCHISSVLKTSLKFKTKGSLFLKFIKLTQGRLKKLMKI